MDFIICFALVVKMGFSPCWGVSLPGRHCLNDPGCSDNPKKGCRFGWSQLELITKLFEQSCENEGGFPSDIPAHLVSSHLEVSLSVGGAASAESVSRQVTPGFDRL